jgi:hypothetical protein
MLAAAVGSTPATPATLPLTNALSRDETPDEAEPSRSDREEISRFLCHALED